MSGPDNKTRKGNVQHRQIDASQAQQYMDSGWPLMPGHKWNAKSETHKNGLLIVRELGKAPRDKLWTTRTYDSATTIAQCLKNHWNVCARIPDKWLVIDIDPRNGGDEGFQNLCEDFGLDPSGWSCVRTGSGGRHYFLRIPADVKINVTLRHDSDTETEFRYRGVEFKTKGTQVVAAGSWHPNGKQYRWVSFERLSDAPATPGNLVRAILRPARAAGPLGGGHISNERLAKALEGLDVREFREHERWRELMMGCHHATGGEGRAEFIEWSCGDPEFEGHEEEIGRRWDSCHADREDGCTVGTINHYLNEAKRRDLFLPAESGRDAVDDDLTNAPPPDNDGESPVRDTGKKKRKGLSFAVAANIEPEPIHWLWKNRIAKGKLTIVAGYPGAGKSQIIVSIVSTVSNGGAWPNGEGKSEQGASLYLSSEDDAADTIVPRLKAAGADMKQVLVMNSIVRDENGTRVFNIVEDLAAMSQVVKDQREAGRDIKLLIIDPISAYMGGTKDTHKNSDVRAALTPLTEWAARHGIAVVAISHFNKSGNGNALYKVTDSLAFTAAARMVWLTGELDDQKIIVAGKSNLAADPGGLSYSIKGVNLTGGIETSRIEWGGPVVTTAAEVFAPKREGRAMSAVEVAKDWLENFLIEGPKEANAVKAAAEEAGHSAYALNEAKKALWVKPKREGFRGPYMWHLPPDNAAGDGSEFG